MTAGKTAADPVCGPVVIEICEPGLVAGWALAGLTADLLAALCSEQRPDHRERRDAISFLANEMLENAVKFRLSGVGPVAIMASTTDAAFDLAVTNPAPPASAEALAALTRELALDDPGDLLIARIEANALTNRESGSGLGILTLMSDYGVIFDWRFDPIRDQEARLVTAHAVLPFH